MTAVVALTAVRPAAEDRPGRRTGHVPPAWTTTAIADGVLEVTDVPDPADHARVFRALAAVTEAVVGPAEFRKLAVLLRDDAGTVSGGLWGATAFGWLQIITLFVPEKLRGRGMGQALMILAESEARARGCVGVQVDAFDFQAAGFYARLGYTPFGVQENHPPGRRRLFFAKPLAGSDDGFPCGMPRAGAR